MGCTRNTLCALSVQINVTVFQYGKRTSLGERYEGTIVGGGWGRGRALGPKEIYKR